MPVNGAICSLKKEHHRYHEQCDEIEEPIDINKNSFSLTSSDELSSSLSNEDLGKIKDALFDDRMQPVSLRIIDFYTDYHKKLKLLIESNLYFEYEEALIQYMCHYEYYGEIYEFSRVEIVEICEISNIDPDVIYSRYNRSRSYMKKK